MTVDFYLVGIFQHYLSHNSLDGNVTGTSGTVVNVGWLSTEIRGD
jgi:small-conductance mechanosensitive channel